MVKVNKNLITRKKYNEIKQYDRNEMDEFLTTIYVNSHIDCYENIMKFICKRFNLDKPEKDLKNIKGHSNDKTVKVIHETLDNTLENLLNDKN